MSDTTTAMVGAVTGVIALLVSVANFVRASFRERLDVRVRATFIPNQIQRIQFKVANHGGTVAHLLSLGCELTDGEDRFIYGISELPAKLDRHEWVIFWIEPDIFDRLSISGFFVVDSVDRKWALHHSEFMEIQRAARAWNARKKEES